MSPLFANAGTPLIMGTMLHLLIGNAIIGIGEAWLIGRIFKVPSAALKGWMIGANYLSFLVGVFALMLYSEAQADRITINDAWTAMAGFALASYAATVVLEWPFVAWACRGRLTTRKALVASLVAQTASYVALAPFYWSASGMTVLTRTRLERSPCFARHPDAVVFFTGNKDGKLYRTKLDGTLPASNSPLFPDQGGVGRTMWVMGLRTNYSTTMISTNSDDQALRLFLDVQKEQLSRNRGPATDLRAGTERAWHVRTGFWSIQGLTANNTNTHESLQLSMETPFVMWHSRCATVLPGDQVVYQLGKQIVLLDIHTRQLAFIGHGQNPVVALPVALGGERVGPALKPASELE